jgi:HD-GYP domain-containing protein (c-di-GMP phosphodiesterase class II)
VTDLAMGAPAEQAARACLVATALAGRTGMPEAAVADVYYTTLLNHVGCTAAYEEAMHLGGDELATRPLLTRTDFGSPREVLTVLTTLGSDRSPLDRAQMVAALLRGGWAKDMQRAVCEVSSLIGARLGMTDAVCVALGQSLERWDGKGDPRGLSGDAISLPARIAHVASRAVAFHALGGADAAVDSVRRSSGGWFDPAICAAFEEHATPLLAELDRPDALEAAIDAEPAPRRTVAGSNEREIARAFADMTDLKSLFTPGHSPGVERLASKAAARLGLGEHERSRLSIAALLHDVGRAGVPVGTWDRQSQLGSADWERIRLHAYYTERILSRSDALSDVAAIAGLHHERLDGSGYHRGARARDLPVAARLLAAADAYQAMTQPRAHRPALSAEAAAVALIAEAQQGRLDPDIVAAVIEAAGGTARVPRTRPAGLTEREVEVLQLMAAGCTNREIADRLVVSPRTAEHHVQHIYEKIGLSTRAAAVMFALEHDLIGR